MYKVIIILNTGEKRIIKKYKKFSSAFTLLKNLRKQYKNELFVLAIKVEKDKKILEY